jgi:nucleoside-diphosphate-sugar epimerase
MRFIMKALSIEALITGNCKDGGPLHRVRNGQSLSYLVSKEQAVLLAVDQPEVAAGQIYNCGDDRQFSVRQIVEIIADELQHQFEILSMPAEVAYPARWWIALRRRVAANTWRSSPPSCRA